jgi:hypothetical protein
MIDGRIRGSGRIVPVVLDCGTKWRWMVRFTPQPLYSREKGYRHPQSRRLKVQEQRKGSYR